MTSTAPFIDAHVHLWDKSVTGLAWTWMTDRGVDADRYSIDEFRAESADAGTAGFVAVHSASLDVDPCAETAWLQELSQFAGGPGAAVGFCALSAPDADALLHGHARHPLVRGVRDLTVAQGLDLDAISAGMRTATALGFSVEMRPPLDQLTRMADLARRWPDTTFIVSHAGLPANRTAAMIEPWRKAMGALAQAPNVVCKIAAVISAETIEPWVLGCLDAFGAARCMLATNWPFDRQYARYGDLVAAYRETVATLSVDETNALFSGTAERVYSIGGTGR